MPSTVTRVEKQRLHELAEHAEERSYSLQIEGRELFQVEARAERVARPGEEKRPAPRGAHLAERVRHQRRGEGVLARTFEDDADGGIGFSAHEDVVPLESPAAGASAG